MRIFIKFHRFIKREVSKLSDINRLTYIDLTRGVVILAILIININYISTPSILRYNPLAFGEFSWLDEWVWFFEYTFIKQRFMPLLALLYGVGIVLFCEKYESRLRKPFWPFIRRSLALIAIGLAHAYLVWDGDVLVAYAVCGILVYALRNISVNWQLTFGLILVAAPVVPEIISIFKQWGNSMDSPVFWSPNQETIDRLLSSYQATWWELTPARIETALSRQTSDFVQFTLWRCCGLMLCGMALYRKEFFSVKRNLKKAAMFAFIVGVGISVTGSLFYVQSSYSYAVFRSSLSLSFYLGTLLLAFAYLCLIVLWGQSNFNLKFKQVVQRIGRCALSIYITQNAIAAFLFYGWGLNLYGTLSRAEIMLVTIIILGAQVTFFNWWMRRWSIGPLESIWRSLYQDKKDDMKTKSDFVFLSRRD